VRPPHRPPPSRSTTDTAHNHPAQPHNTPTASAGRQTARSTAVSTPHHGRPAPRPASPPRDATPPPRSCSPRYPSPDGSTPPMPYWTSRSAPLCLWLRPRLVVNTYQRRTIHDTSQVATGSNRSRPFHADLPGGMAWPSGLCTRSKRSARPQTRESANRQQNTPQPPPWYRTVITRWLSVPTDPGSPLIYYDTTTDNLRRCIGLLQRPTKLRSLHIKDPRTTMRR
jgi:hypothetical protein